MDVGAVSTRSKVRFVSLGTWQTLRPDRTWKDGGPLRRSRGGTLLERFAPSLKPDLQVKTCS